MRNIEDYELEYNLFLAENDMHKDLIKAGSNIVLSEELTVRDIKAINEGLQDSVSNYVNKVIESTQDAWNRFKTNVAGDKDRQYLESCKHKVETAKPDFMVNNFPSYNLNTLRNYKVERFSYEIMKDDLKSQKEFMQKHYLSLYSEHKEISTMMAQNVLTGYTNLSVDRTKLMEIYDFCSTEFYNTRRSIEADLSVLNESANTMIRNANTVISTAQESVDFYNNIINEIENPHKMSFTDSDGEHVDPGKEASDNQNRYMNDISTYMKISTNIISAKMKLMAQMFTVYMNIIRHFADTIQYGDSSSNPNSVSQVDI